MNRRREKAAPVIAGSRRAAREFAFRILFEASRSNRDVTSVLERAEQKMIDGDDSVPSLNETALAFGRELVLGFAEHSTEIDQRLKQTIRGWSFEQMAQTDLCILRIAVYEMLFTREVHPPLIESATRIAHKFGGDDSGRFINGVLAGFSRELHAEQGTSQ